MEGASDHVAYQQVTYRCPEALGLRYFAEDDACVPAPEEREGADFGVPAPAPASYFPAPEDAGACGLEEEDVGVGVEVEAREGHDDVEELVLDGEEDARGGVECHDAFVVGRVERGEELRGDGEEGDMFDVWVTGIQLSKLSRGIKRRNILRWMIRYNFGR